VTEARQFAVDPRIGGAGSPTRLEILLEAELGDPVDPVRAKVRLKVVG
jgi:hypothetical protein